MILLNGKVYCNVVTLLDNKIIKNTLIIEPSLKKLKNKAKNLFIKECFKVFGKNFDMAHIQDFTLESSISGPSDRVMISLPELTNYKN